MADVSKIKLPSGTTYNIKDKNALPLTGGSVTGPVSFGDSVSIDEATIGDLVVNGSAGFTNNIQVNTINGIAVGNNPKFTDTTYSSLSAASGGTAVSLVTTGEKYTWNSKTSNIGTITSVKTTAGTHTTINTTSGAVSFNVPTKTSHLTNDSGYVTSSGVTSITLKAGSGISLDTDNTAITTTGTRTISHADTSSQASSSNSGRTYIQSLTLDSYGHVTGISTATESVTNTDTKLQVAAVTSGTQYYPIVGTGTSAATRQFDTTGFKYKGTNGTTSAIGSAILELGNSTASGTANNKQAQLIMYGSNAKKATITLAAPSANVALALPTSSGTLALTNQIPSISVTQKTTTGTNIADVTVNGTTTQLFAPNGGGGDHEDLTQAEYDALTEAKKMDGTVYFITDAISEPLQNYSSTPVAIARLNGQVIYRKVFTGNTPSTSNSVVFTDKCLNTIINMSGYVLNTGNTRLILPAYYVNNSDYMVMYPQNGSMKIVMGNTGVLGNRPYVCIIDYLG